MTNAYQINEPLASKYRKVIDDWRMIPIIAALAKKFDAEIREKARNDYHSKKAKDPTFAARHNASSKKAMEKYVASGKFNTYMRERRKSNPQNIALDKYRRAMNQALQLTKKSKVFEALVGCDIQTFKAYIEAQFKEGMHWGNRGKKAGCWCLDHVRPVSTFRLDDPAERKLAFHFQNTQPIWVIENASKGSMWDGKRVRY